MSAESKGSQEHFEYAGVIHIHSSYSDGSGEVSEIASDAREAGLDFIVLTDHNTLKAKEIGWEGWRDGLLVMVGDEVTGPDGHCISLGLDTHVRHRRHTHQVVQEILERGGLCFIVHPEGSWRPFLRSLDHSWRDWSHNSYTGMEIWSYMFDWASKLRFYSFWRMWRRPDEYITGPSAALLGRWDTLCQGAPVVAIGGVDVHARKLDPFGRIVVFPYADMFRTVRTHILVREGFSGSFRSDAAILMSALRSGHCFIGYDLLADTRGFRFHSTDGRWQMGDVVPWSQALQAEILVPIPGHINVVRNGVPLISSTGASLAFDVDQPGVYRTEVRLDGRPWIYSNPLYVRL